MIVAAAAALILAPAALAGPNVRIGVVDDAPIWNDATGYLQLLASTYDAIKSTRPNATVIGGALAPHGNDAQSHSPTTFIRDLGVAYRASGRKAPIMDVWDEHARRLAVRPVLRGRERAGAAATALIVRRLPSRSRGWTASSPLLQPTVSVSAR